MDLQQIVERLWKEREVIGNAPVAFVLSLLALGAILFALFQWRYSDRLDSLEGRIKLKDDLIASYKTKLDGASPDQAKERIVALEARCSELRIRNADDIVNALREAGYTATADGGFAKLPKDPH